uniref:U3 small nucleolar RNA-associated protein 11 n=1 Tax=Syphacia muris TaxID=451379 RepID=A0A0N5AZ46_9BILA
MSSLKRSAKIGQRIHRERSQPENRQRLGLLEKKKDYIVRARDYNTKKRRLQYLKRKALERNPDEFHYHMVRSQVQEGVHHDLTPEPDEDTKLQKKLSNIQDLRYLQHLLSVENKKIEKMKSTLHLADFSATKNKHTVFVDSDKEAKNFDPAKYFNTTEELLDRTYNRPLISTLNNSTMLCNVSKTDVEEATKERRIQYKELLKRLDRAKELTIAVQKLEVRKNIADSKGKQLKPIKVAKGEPMKARVFKWVYERKR